MTLFVVHWNRPRECIATVRSLIAQKGDLHVIIVDNASTPENYAILSGELRGVAALVQLPANQGWGPALNVVLKSWLDSETQPWCLISAHDAVAHNHCLSLLLQVAGADARVGIACPQYPDASVPRLSALRGVWHEQGVPQPAGTAQEVDVPHGTLMLVRRECLAQIGLFDERYFAYGDEHELGARAVRAGWKVVLVWGAIVTNPGTWTPSPLRSYFFARNSLLLVRRYRGAFWALLRALFIVANTLRLMLRAPEQAFAFSAKARLRAIKDYALGRSGLPDWAG